MGKFDVFKTDSYIRVRNANEVLLPLDVGRCEAQRDDKRAKRRMSLAMGEKVTELRCDGRALYYFNGTYYCRRHAEIMALELVLLGKRLGVVDEGGW